MRKPNSLATICAISGSTMNDGDTLLSPICLSITTTSLAFLDMATASSRTGIATAGICSKYFRENDKDCPYWLEDESRLLHRCIQHFGEPCDMPRNELGRSSHTTNS